jgi:hypothetical protein
MLMISGKQSIKVLQPTFESAMYVGNSRDNFIDKELYLDSC